MRAAAFVQLRCVGLYPAPDATGIHFHAALRQKFGDVLVGEGIAQVPADAQQNHLAREMASFERMGRGDRHGLLRYQTASPISQWNRSFLERVTAIRSASRFRAESTSPTSEFGTSIGFEGDFSV